MNEDEKSDSDREVFASFCAMRELSADQVANALLNHNEKVLNIVSTDE